MVGQAGCTDAICSAGSSTNTTDKLHERICAPYGLIPVRSHRGLPAPPSKSTEPCAGCRCVGIHGHAVGHSTAGDRPTAVPAAVSGGPRGLSHYDDQLLDAAAGRLE